MWRIFAPLRAAFSQAKTQREPFLTHQESRHHDLVFVRHAESIFNLACERYRLAHNIPYVWKELCNHQGFDSSVLYNPDFIDCSITEKGKEECLHAQKMLKDSDVDCVIVSPLLRALQTCQIVFKGKDVPVFVQPLLTGPLRSVSDVSGYITLKKVLFPKFNFTATDGQEQLWFLEYLSEEQRVYCRQRFMEKGIYDIKQMKNQVVNLLRNKQVHEDVSQFRKRVQDMKEMIGRYRQTYKKVAIVSHYYSIQYMTAMNYNEDGTPECYLDIKNCTPYYSSLESLLSIKEIY